jgi:hypothetical protein
MKTTKRPSRLAPAILEMAGDHHSLGIMVDDAFKKVTSRHGGKPSMTAEPISPEGTPKGALFTQSKLNACKSTNRKID